MQIEESERTTRFELTYPRKARQLVRVNGFNAALAAFVAPLPAWISPIFNASDVDSLCTLLFLAVCWGSVSAKDG